MPAFYVDLIEMYGDGPGRARFGLGENIRPTIRAQFDPNNPSAYFDANPLLIPDEIESSTQDAAASSAPNAARSFNAGADVGEAVQDLSMAARMARLGANAPAVGAGLERCKSGL